MILGIPRGYFLYDYKKFTEELFKNTDIKLYFGKENSDEIIAMGSRTVVDEACIPIKLLVGQINKLKENCDFILVPRIMKDFKGKWLCPKLLGLPEIAVSDENQENLIITEPIYFDDKRKCKKTFAKIFKSLDIDKRIFEKNFKSAYEIQRNFAYGLKKYEIEASWEFVPPVPAQGEIILPNTKKVFLAGHCYNIYDKFFNGNIMKKLDDLGIEAITENKVNPVDRENVIKEANLIKKPFWEAFVRTFGSALYLKDKVDGIIYLSSFSCGTDSFITEMIKIYIPDIPIMVLKLDEHKGSAGYETRLEAFSDLLERRQAS
ncbi:MAG: acyl-CoA dehydratase activase-related protein [Anaerovoracaceae bacterium]